VRVFDRGWLMIAWLAALSVTLLGACGKLEALNGKAVEPVFNTIQLDAFTVREFRLKDGTHCVTYQTALTCDWSSK
jgi:hypothetical protein